MSVQIFCQIHHAVEIRVGLIEFHQCKLRIVLCIHTLIAENPADLIHLFKSANDQTLEVQFQRNAQLQVLIQRIEMRKEGSCRGAAGILNQHGRLDLQEPLSVEISPNAADDA